MILLYLCWDIIIFKIDQYQKFNSLGLPPEAGLKAGIYVQIIYFLKWYSPDTLIEKRGGEIRKKRQPTKRVNKLVPHMDNWSVNSLGDSELVQRMPQSVHPKGEGAGAFISQLSSGLVEG